MISAPLLLLLFSTVPVALAGIAIMCGARKPALRFMMGAIIMAVLSATFLG